MVNLREGNHVVYRSCSVRKAAEIYDSLSKREMLLIIIHSILD